MRIIKGSLQRRLIHPPAKLPVRPTTDLAKESLFNILENRIDFEGIIALDLFSGTGNIAYELISRGCGRVVAVDNHYPCIRFIRETAAKFDLNHLLVIKANVFRYLQTSREQFDLIFADPPYDMENFEALAALILDKELLKPEGWLVIEHPKIIDYTGFDGYTETRRYGKVHFSFFQP